MVLKPRKRVISAVSGPFDCINHLRRGERLRLLPEKRFVPCV